MNHVLERRLRLELARLREHLHGELSAELAELEADAVQLVDHERCTLVRCLELFVHKDERAGVLERAAATWPWSRSHKLGECLYKLQARMQSRAAVGDEPADSTRFDLRASHVDAAAVHEWMEEGANRIGPTVGLVHDEAQMACLYMALPDSVREARRLWRLTKQIASGDAQRYLLEVIAPPEIERSETTPSVPVDVAAGQLAEAVRRHIDRFRRTVALFGQKPPRTSAEADSTAHQLDLAFADYVQELGDAGKTCAELVRAASAQRARNRSQMWRLWCSDPEGEYFLVSLARVLWIDEVQSELKRRERNHEALAMPVHVEVVKMYSRAGVPSADTRQMVFEDGTTISFESPLMDAAGLALVYRGMGLLGSVDSHRLLQWQVRSGYEQWISGEPNPHILDVERGYGELAERLNIRDKGATARLRAILTAQRACAFPLPGPVRATSNLIILTEWEGKGRRPSRIRIELGSMLMPTFVHELRSELKGRSLAAMQRLVPLVGLPPFVGDRASHGAQATLAMLVARELRIRAAELYQSAGQAIPIDLSRWAALAAEARIPRSLVNQQLASILDRWTRDGDDAPAFLKREGRENFTLGDQYEPARRFLLEAGRREAEGSEAGRRSAKKRQTRGT